jgi:hypothetical protein
MVCVWCRYGFGKWYGERDVIGDEDVEVERSKTSD